jgi:hypothetical protein
MATGRIPTTANSPLTVKGDLFGYSTTQARVPVGNDGETLVADSSATTGLRYTAGTVQTNPVLNSSFQVWQRGTSFAYTTSGVGGAYTADRYVALVPPGPATTYSRQSTADTTNLPFIQYCMRVARNNGQTNTGSIYLTSSMESINSIPFVGKTVTFSFYARKGADYSATSSILGGELNSGTGTDQNINAGFTGSTNVVTISAALTTTWQRFTYTGTVSSTANQLGFYFYYAGTGTAGANDYFEVTGVQIDVGSVALPFRTYAGTIQGELAACQRYYWKAGGDNVYQYLGMGTAVSSTETRFLLPHPVQMRVKPTAIEFSTLAVYDVGGAAFYAATTVTQAVASVYTSGVTLNVASGLTTQRPFIAVTNNSLSGYIAFSAEL